MFIHPYSIYPYKAPDDIQKACPFTFELDVELSDARHGEQCGRTYDGLIDFLETCEHEFGRWSMIFVRDVDDFGPNAKIKLFFEREIDLIMAKMVLQ